MGKERIIGVISSARNFCRLNLSPKASFQLDIAIPKSTLLIKSTLRIMGGIQTSYSVKGCKNEDLKYFRPIDKNHMI